VGPNKHSLNNVRKEVHLEHTLNGFERYSNMAETMHKRDFRKLTHLEWDWLHSIIIRIPQLWTSAQGVRWTGRDVEQTHPGKR